MRPVADDDFLFTYIPEEEETILTDIPAEADLHHEFSSHFEKKMQKLIKHERRNKLRRILIQTAKVAMITILLLVIVNTALVCSVDAYREQFFKLVGSITVDYRQIPGSGEVPFCGTYNHTYVPSARATVKGEYVDSEHCYSCYQNTTTCTKCGHTVISRDLLLHDMKLSSTISNGSCQTWVYTCHNCGRKRATEIHPCYHDPLNRYCILPI